MAQIQFLECTKCGEHLSAGQPRTICPKDGGSLFVRYDLTAIRKNFTRESLAGQPASMWRYAAVLPDAPPVTLGEGFTQPPGFNHAEIEALIDARRNGHDLHGATAYISLEPCSHFGRTPPCVTALIEARLARVLAAVEDPNPQVAGRGLEALRAGGIDVRCGLLAAEATEMNVGFFSRMKDFFDTLSD